MNFRTAIPVRWRPKIRHLVYLPNLPRLRHVELIIRKDTSSCTVLPIDEMANFLSEPYMEKARTDGYSPKNLDARGLERATKLVDLIPPSNVHKTLELGGGDGMTSAHLVRLRGAEATCIDLLDTSDSRAHSTGVKFRFADVHSLSFSDGEFDLAFSFAAFEHFTNPGKVLQETLRVVRPGGYIYLEFGPLYYAPYGLHAYRQFPFPYPQLLFSFEDLKAYVANEIPAPDWVRPDYLNKYRYDQYRSILDPGNGAFTIKFYDESLDFSGLNMMERFPSCFRIPDFEIKDFVTNAIMILLQRS